MPETNINIIMQPTKNVAQPGEVREELRITFDATLNKMDMLVDKVYALANHAENYFWSFRQTALRAILGGENGTSGMLAQCETGAQKLCLAAYPMIDEIVERLHYISGVSDPYVHVGEETDPPEHTWDYANSGAAATRTFYLPIVADVCATLKSYIQQMRQWSENSEGWQDEGTATIRQLYGAALLDLYAQTRRVIDQLGPLFPKVICNSYPEITELSGISGNNELFLPTTCVVTKKDTQTFDLELYSNTYKIPFTSAVTGYAAYQNTPTSVSNGENVYRSRGGLLSIEQLDVSDSVDLTGVYEICEFSDSGNLLINNENLISAPYESSEPDSLYGTSFRMRLIREAELDTDADDKVYIQYRTSVENVSDAQQTQEFSWDLDKYDVGPPEVPNSHTTPSLVSPGGSLLYWKRYDLDTHFGTSYLQNVTIENVSKDTLFVTDATSFLCVNGPVYAIAKDATYLYIGGNFTEVGGETIPNLARITLLTGEVDDTWAPITNGYVTSIAIDGSGNIFAGGWFFNVDDNESLNCLVKFDSAGTLQTTWAPDPDLYVTALAVDVATDDLYVGGAFTTISGVTRHGIACYDSAGVLKTTFSQGVNGVVKCIAVAGTDVCVGGEFEVYDCGVLKVTNFAKYNTSGVLDEAAKPDPDDYVSTICIDGNGNTYIGGAFLHVYDCEPSSVQQDREYLAKYDTDMHLVAAFDASLNGEILAIDKIASNYIYVGGAFTSILGETRNNLALIDDTGGIEAYAPSIDNYVFALYADADDNLFVGGSFTTPFAGCYVWDEANELPVPGWVPEP